jgi:hypothetical protein
MRNVQASTARSRLPVDFTSLSRTQGKLGPVNWSSPRGGTTRTGGPGVLSVVDGRFAGKACAFGAVFGSLVLCDGPVKAGGVNHAIIIATGNVKLAHVDNSVVIAKGRIEVSHDGTGLEYGHGFSSLLLSGSRIEASHLAGSVLGAADGVVVSSPNGVVLLNTPGSRSRLEVMSSAGVILDDAIAAEYAYEAALQPDLPVRAGVWLFRQGADVPIGFAREGHELFGGWRVAFASPETVLLRRPGEKLALVPTRPRKPPPAAPRLAAPAEVEIHQVGAYSASRPDSVITVEVNRPGAQVLLVLGAYEAVSWDVRLAKDTTLAGVVLGGYHAPDGITGLTPGTPVVTRVHDYGEPYFFDYPKPGQPGLTGAPSGGGVEPNAGKRAVRELTDREPSTFQGAEQLDRVVIQ